MKIHIGCGTVKIPEYMNVDIRYLPNVDVVDNGKYLRKFVGERIEAIYACHVLEHFSRWDITSILKRWYDLLMPDGLLFLAVPDFASISEYYQRTKDMSSLIGLLYGGQDYDENFHHICWDFNTLSLELKKAGFVSITRYDWRTSEFAQVDDYSKSYLPHKDFQNGMLMSLNVRASKLSIGRESNWLHSFHKVVKSQHGEDGIINKIFEIIGERNKCCVEFGAGNGYSYSNTWNLIVNKGWVGIEIEAELGLFDDLQETYAGLPVTCILRRVNYILPDMLDKILAGTPIPTDFDFLSIDIDSYDYQVWDSVQKYRPRVVCIEFCQAFKNSEDYIYGQDDKWLGSSLSSLAKLGKVKGYELVAVIGVNALFVTAELFPLFGIADNSPANYAQYISPGDR
jgi:predicted SAM-dependent methyltransferase